MNDVLLINRIDVRKEYDSVRNIFFIIDYGSEKYSEYNIVNLFNSIGDMNISDIIFRYNGFQIKTEIRNIPYIIKALMDEGILVYSVFEQYSPVV